MKIPGGVAAKWFVTALICKDWPFTKFLIAFFPPFNMMQLLENAMQIGSSSSAKLANALINLCVNVTRRDRTGHGSDLMHVLMYFHSSLC